MTKTFDEVANALMTLCDIGVFLAEDVRDQIETVLSNDMKPKAAKFCTTIDDMLCKKHNVVLDTEHNTIKVDDNPHHMTETVQAICAESEESYLRYVVVTYIPMSEWFTLASELVSTSDEWKEFRQLEH